MASTYTLLASNTLSADTATVTFSSIPASYTDLIIKLSDRSDTANALYYAYMRFNGSSSNVYASNFMYAQNATRAAGSDPATTGYFWDDPTTTLGSTATANTFSNKELYIPNYVSGNYKPLSYDYAVPQTSDANSFRGASAGLFISTDPITSISLYNYGTGKFVAGSTFKIYGVWKGTGTTLPSTPTIGIATAGDASASITFTPTSATGVDAGYTALSTPGSITASAGSSPITVSGLTNGTAYTFQVKANNPGGSSAYSAASNSVTPLVPNNYESIATATLGSNSTTVTISSIPNTYASLQIRIIGKAATNANFGGIFGIRFNGDTNVNYSYAGWNSAASTPATMLANGETSANWQGVMPLNGASITNMWGVAIIDINNYASTSLQKSTKTIAGWCGRTIDIGYTTQTSGLWQSTSAINSITFVHNNTWLAGSQFALYGIKD